MRDDPGRYGAERGRVLMPPPDEAQEPDPPLLQEMGDLLDSGGPNTGSFLTIDQFGGPQLSLDQFETTVMQRFDQLETMQMPAIKLPTATSGNPRASRIADAPTLRHLPSLTRRPTDADATLRPPARARDRAASGTVAGDAVRRAPDESSPGQERPVWEFTTLTLKAIGPRVESFAAVARKLLKSSGFYAIASLGGPAVSLALTPFLAHHLAPSSYGAFAILNTVISLAAGITQLGLGSAFFRAYNYDYTSTTDRRAVLATVSLLLLVITTPIALLAIALAPMLSRLIFQRSDLSSLVVLAAIAMLAQNLTVPGFAWLRAENRALLFSLVSMTNILLTLGATIVLVGPLRMGVQGALIAVILGYCSVVALVFPPIVVSSRLRFSPKIARSVLAFGAPLIFSVISMWILQLSDRYLLEIYGTLAETASYSIAYTLGSTLSTLILAPFSLAWPTAMYAIAKRRDAPKVFQTVFRWFSSILLLAAFGLSLVSTVIFNVLFPPSYHAAAPVIPIVAESIAFYGIYTILMIGANVRRKTWMTAVFTAIAALLNFLLNLFLIPRYGAMGAAYSTLIAYIALTGIAYVANQRIYPLPFQVGRFVFAAIVGLAIYYEIFALPAYIGERWVWPLAVVGMLLYGGWLVVLSLLAPGAASAGTPTPQPAIS